MHIFKKVNRIEGVFSGTLSYIFNEFSTGSADGPSFSTVVRTARDKGYTVRFFLRSPITVYHPPPTLTHIVHSLGTSPSRRPERRRRRAQTDHPHPSPHSSKPATTTRRSDPDPNLDPPRRLRLGADSVPDPSIPRTLFRPHGRRVPRRAPNARLTLWYAPRRSRASWPR